jgi:hypothetical protein
MRRLGIAGLVVVIGMPAMAAGRLICTFTTECIAGAVCGPVSGLAVDLIRRGDSWIMDLKEDQASARFDPVAGATGSGLQLFSTELDPDADAVSLLSIAPDGQAILSTHGFFPGPGAVTQLGICTKKDS